MSSGEKRTQTTISSGYLSEASRSAQSNCRASKSSKHSSQRHKKPRTSTKSSSLVDAPIHRRPSHRSSGNKPKCKSPNSPHKSEEGSQATGSERLSSVGGSSNKSNGWCEKGGLRFASSSFFCLFPIQGFDKVRIYWHDVSPYPIGFILIIFCCN